MFRKAPVLLALAVTFTPISSFAITAKAKSNQFWWPETLDLSPLRQHSQTSNPLGEDFDYASAFKRLDFKALKQDLDTLMKTSQPWWPADYGHYGPLFIRMAWHSAGTYRVADGRGGAEGGQQRFEPLNSWPDNANLDKARRLLWPIKKKYGQQISWADLIVLAGNVALESMGFKTLGFAAGREDDWEADRVYWGPEHKFLDDKRYSGQRDLEKPLAAVQMGLIYVNPEGPNANHDPISAAKDIRETFGRMSMNDEETVALIAGGHTFGKAHGAVKPSECLGAEPAASGIEHQGLGWINRCNRGNAQDTLTSGLEGAWSVDPVAWTHQYLDNLFKFEWVQTKTPAGAVQWIPKDEAAASLVPDAHDPSKRHPPIMFTTDLSLKEDPIYQKIAKRFHEDPKAFEQAFAKAWFKLIHRDMGPSSRYIPVEGADQVMLWQDPIPKVNHEFVNDSDIASLKERLKESGLSHGQLVQTAWASASTFRASDKRGGANGARIQLMPQKEWAVNQPEELAKLLSVLGTIKNEFNQSQSGTKKISLADLIVLGAGMAIENAALQAGYKVEVPFIPGRMDATQEQTDIPSFAVLEPKADGFRNYLASDIQQRPIDLLVDKAQQLNLSVPEMVVLLGGLRVLGVNTHQSKHGVLTKKTGTLSNDFFVNLMDMSTQWKKASDSEGIYEGFDRDTHALKWTATSVDLIMGSNGELRAVAEVYAADDGQEKFVQDFIRAWTKVMRLDRFDLKA